MPQAHGLQAPKLGSIFLSRRAKSAPRPSCAILSLVTVWDSNSPLCQSKTHRISPPCLPGFAPYLVPAVNPNRPLDSVAQPFLLALSFAEGAVR